MYSEWLNVLLMGSEYDSVDYQNVLNNLLVYKYTWIEVFHYIFNLTIFTCVTAQKVKFFSKYLLSKYYQTRSFLQIWSHLLKKSFMENFIFCAMCAQKSRGTFKTQSNIKMELVEKIKAVIFFLKKLYRRCLTGFWIRL